MGMMDRQIRQNNGRERTVVVKPRFGGVKPGDATLAHLKVKYLLNTVQKKKKVNTKV